MSDGQDLEQRAILELVGRLASERIAPQAAETDRTGAFPVEVVDLLREHGLLGLPFAASYGGSGTGPLTFLLAVRELARTCATTALTLAMQETGSLPIKLAGTEEQKQRWLPPLASGQWLAAFALTEAEAGSDAAAVAMRAQRNGSDYVLDGTKRFITNAGVAGLYVVFARVDGDPGGLSAFVVEADRAGVNPGRLESKLGLRGSPTGELMLDACRVPAGNLLGRVGDGFRLAMRVLDRSRPGVAAQALGIAEGALAYALGYAKTRRTFGKPLIEHQLVAAKLADMATACAAGAALLERVGLQLAEGVDGLALTRAAAEAKLFCSDTAVRVTSDALQVLGGYGYTTDYPLERMLRDARVTQIYEGTNEIQRLVIARTLAQADPASRLGV